MRLNVRDKLFCRTRHGLLAGLLGLLACVHVSSGQIVPTKTWYAPGQPVHLANEGDDVVELALAEFKGQRVEADPVPVDPGEQVDLREILAELRPGTYVLYPVEPGGAIVAFTSTPWVISIRTDTRPDANREVMVTKVEPLRYAVIETQRGPATVAFYYDVAPNTVANFLSLVEGGFYDGLSFHRIVPGFVIQGGDPKGDSSGGPGYMIDAEFNNRPHVPGVLSMARSGDPLEAQGAMPRSDAANSAGSQFFIALDYENTRRLDGRYTAFGRVVEGMETIREIGSVEIANEQTGEPAAAQPIEKVRVERVKPGTDPYARLFDVDESVLRERDMEPDRPVPVRPATRPATQPGGRRRGLRGANCQSRWRAL